MKKIINLVIGLGLLAFAIYHHSQGMHLWAVIKDIVGLSILYSAFKPGRTSQIIIGHTLIVAGAMLFAGGIYLAPIATEIVRQNGVTLGVIFGMPLFWSLICMGGGVCSIYHGFCNCVSGKGCAKNK